MAGGRSVYFDTDAETIVYEVMEEFHHKTFSAAVQFIIKDYEKVKRSMNGYKLELHQLQAQFNHLATTQPTNPKADYNKTCSRCGHEWKSRVASPKKCPECQSLNWQVFE